MNVKSVALAIVVASAQAATARAQPPAKYALLIGINTYSTGLDVPTLSYAEQDVNDMEKALTIVGYDVKVLKGFGTTRLAIVSALQYYASTMKPDDTFLLYFAGHGVRNPTNQKIYWLAADTALAALEGTGIRMSHLLDYFADVRARRKVLLLDHCLSGDMVSTLAAAAATPPAAGGPPATATPTVTDAGGDGGSGSRGTGGSVRIERRNVEPIKATMDKQWTDVPAGVLMLAAARNDAFESDTIKHGVFTAALLEAFGSREADTSKDGQLSADELTAFLARRVPVIAGALRPPQVQNIADYKSGSFASFTLTSTLPLTDAQQARVESDRLQKVVSSWRGKGYLPTEEAVLCYEALQKLADSSAGSAPLDPLYDAIVRQLRELAALITLSEQGRAVALVQEIRRLRGAQ